jgi:hypothetical protein
MVLSSALLRAFIEPEDFSQVALRATSCSTLATGRRGARAGLAKAACALESPTF